MPLIGTRAAVSANAYGFCSLGGSYWLSTLGGVTSQLNAWTAAADNNGNMYAVSLYTPSSVRYFLISKISSYGNLIWQVQLNPAAVNLEFYFYEPTVSVDASGNVYCLGYARNTATSQESFYLVKHDTFGVLQWSRNLECDASNLYACANDTAGNIIIAGRKFTGTSDIQIALYNSSGTLQWQRQLTSASQESCVGVTTDSSNNIYIIGDYTPSSSNILIVKYNTSGAIQWQRQLNDPITVNLTALSIKSDGTNIYGLGYSVSGGGVYTAYVFKYNASGTLLWQRKLQVNNLFGDGQLALTSAGDVYVCGGTTTFSSGLAYVAKYNTSGVLQWQRRIGVNTGSTGTAGVGAAIDNKGGLLLQLKSGGTTSVGSITARLPIDGTKTGTYALSTFSIDYIVGSVVESAGALVSSTLTLTDSSTSLTSNNQTTTSTASAVSYTATQI